MGMKDENRNNGMQQYPKAVSFADQKQECRILQPETAFDFLRHLRTPDRTMDTPVCNARLDVPFFLHFSYAFVYLRLRSVFSQNSKRWVEKCRKDVPHVSGLSVGISPSRMDQRAESDIYPPGLDLLVSALFKLLASALCHSIRSRVLAERGKQRRKALHFCTHEEDHGSDCPPSSGCRCSGCRLIQGGRPGLLTLADSRVCAILPSRPLNAA